jgi:glycosyltransferase involved in cell wall biosynthesis
VRHLIVTLDFPPAQDGGIARWMATLAEGLHRRGEAVEVVTRRGPVLATPFPVRGLWGHSWVRWHRAWLRAWAPTLPRDAVLHAATCSIAAALAPRYPRSAVYVHGLELAEAEPETLGRAWRVIANSRFVADLAISRGARPERVHVVHPAVPAREGRAARAPGAPTVLSLGRLVRRKAQDVLIRAWPEVRRIVPDAELVVAGDGPERAALEAMSGPGVRFLGRVPEAELDACYGAADVYALVPRELGADVEGFGITYLEAMRAGLPVVATRCGGVAEAVGDVGVYVARDDVTATAAAIVALLRDPERRRAMAEAGRARVREVFGTERMVSRVLDVLTSEPR